jgi:hypothetical protein
MATELMPPDADLRDPRRRRNFSSLLWLCGWGGATLVALSAFAIATQTKTAGERLRQIFQINEPAAVAQMPSRMARVETNVKALADQIQMLAGDRDRLSGRISLLESSIDDMTGAIKRQAAATAALAAKGAAPPAPSAPPAAASTAVATPPVLEKPQVIAATPMADAPTTEPVPLPPARVAAAAPSEAASSPANQTEFGLDLGTAATLDGVRERWNKVKANFGPMLSGMYPLAARDPRPGSTGYRLVVGPLPNSVAATGLCAHFTAARTACRSVKFNGEDIAQH